MSTVRVPRILTPIVPLPPTPGHNTTMGAAENQPRLVAWTVTRVDSADRVAGPPEQRAAEVGEVWAQADSAAAASAVVGSVAAVFAADFPRASQR